MYLCNTADYPDRASSVVSWNRYQASVLSLTEHGYSQEEARKLLILSVQLAIDARDEWWSEQLPRATSRRRPLIALSMGPYGAALSNGAECWYGSMSLCKQAENRR